MIAGWRCLRQELCFVHQAAFLNLVIINARNLPLTLISVVCGAFHGLFSLLNVISEDVSLGFGPLSLAMLGQHHEVESALCFVRIGSWSRLLFLTVEYLSDISRLRLLVQRVVYLAVYFIEHGAGVRHRILRCGTIKLN